MSDLAHTSVRPIIPALNGLARFFEPAAEPLLRLVTGLLLVPHGAQKLFEWFGGNTAGTAAFFSKFGLEPALQLVYLTGAIEFFGGILLAIGLGAASNETERPATAYPTSPHATTR